MLSMEGSRIKLDAVQFVGEHEVVLALANMRVIAVRNHKPPATPEMDGERSMRAQDFANMFDGHGQGQRVG